ncbi:putative patatin-like phospholipase [Phaeomoniella chlamydospora]|uniref:Putative patatin-like phospholipase n=1 Tax=Phaeomoniella chlamydospora TaxID=158046 RepID=A0A0G2GGD7_PHACM|nr:putative patatin-like phospholipase [Phaeomoniella chlamydospora]
MLINQIPNPDIQKPSLLVLIGNTAKSVALRELFGVKKAQWFKGKPGSGKVHLHLDPSSIFSCKPLLLADVEFSKHNLRDKAATADKCHETTKRVIRRDGQCLDDIAEEIYTHLLFPFVDVFCFFASDLGGFRQIARHLAAWLERGTSPTLPKGPCPRLIIVTDKVLIRPGSETEARKAFLWILREETVKDPLEQFSAIDVVALSPVGKISADARHRILKDRLMYGSAQMRKDREDTRTLFTLTHFGAFSRASRAHNPVAPDLSDHLSTFLGHVKTPTQLIEFAVPMIASSFLLDNYPPDAHLFDPSDVFRVLYRDTLFQLCGGRVLDFERSDVLLRSGFVGMIETRLREFFEQLIHKSGKSAVEIHGDTLERFKERWHNIRSDRTCLCCLRRRPQHNLNCVHCVCETCVVNLGDPRTNDPWEFEVRRCFLCKVVMPEEVVVRVHPPTTGVGILCLDGGGVRGMVPLGLMKRIQDCIGLPIPFQKFFKVVFGISSGGLIILAMFINGWSVDHSTEMFENLAKLAFQRRKVLDIPFLSRLQELLMSYFADGLYSAQNIEAALRDVFGVERSILDCSYATSTGTRIGVPVATVQDRPSCRVFTNYNGNGVRHEDQGLIQSSLLSSVTLTQPETDDHIIKPKDGFGRVPVWEIARSASAAPGFFPPRAISDVGVFQDPGPLENDPLVSALCEATAAFPSVEEPDFILSLGTGEPRVKADNRSADGLHNVLKNGAFPRLCRMLWEKMRDKKVRQAFQTHPRYHRLDVQYDHNEPRLDDVRSIPELKSKVGTDDSLTYLIENVARVMVASLFYFELDSIPERFEGKRVGYGYIRCALRCNSPAFSVLLNQLSGRSALFYSDDNPITREFGDPAVLDGDGNFRLRVDFDIDNKFTISLKQGDSAPCDISGSPYSIDKLIAAQGLDAYLGTADHRKRKRQDDDGPPARKKQRI